MAKYIIFILACGLLAAASALPNFRGKFQTGRIVGGQDALLGELPYYASLKTKFTPTPVCGGSLVILKEQQVIITAAHCVGPDSTLPDIVIAGDIDRIYYIGSEQVRNVTRIKVHENYDESTFANDIAVITIDYPFEINNYIKPIALPESRQQTTGKVYISGYGNSSDGSQAQFLQYAKVPVIDDDTCQKAYDGKPILESMLCTGLLGEGGHSCPADAGGPVRGVGLKNGWLPYYYLAGVISGGNGCGDPRYPGVSTEVSYFIDWLNNQI